MVLKPGHVGSLWGTAVKTRRLPVPEGPGVGVPLDRESLARWHNHLIDNGPLDHFHDPAAPDRFRGFR